MNRSTLRAVFAPALILALALPAAATTSTGHERHRRGRNQRHRHRRRRGNGDLVSVNTSRSVSCVDADGNSDNSVTLKSVTLPDAVVDVPELLRRVSASGTGTMTVTVIDRCSPSFPTTRVPGVSVSISGTRTSMLENVGTPFFRALLSESAALNPEPEPPDTARSHGRRVCVAPPD